MSKKNPLPRSPAIWRIAERHRPISGDPLGDYLQIAVPNMAARNFRGGEMPSFEKPYKLETDHMILKPKDLARKLHEYGLKYKLRQWNP